MLVTAILKGELHIKSKVTYDSIQLNSVTEKELQYKKNRDEIVFSFKMIWS